MSKDNFPTVTVESIEDPDDVAPYVDVGYEFGVASVDSLGAGLRTEEGSPVRVKLSDTPGVYLFGATDEDISPARVTFSESLDNV